MSNKQIRDTVFRDFFTDPKRLASLSAASLNVKNIDPASITQVTLDKSFDSVLRNDIACIVQDVFLVLIEHQTTINNNMPIRMLSYVAEIYQKYAAPFKRQLYRAPLVKLPRPKFVVFYDGEVPTVEYEQLRLSDAFDGDASSLELVVDVYNITGEMNDALKRNCEDLRQYSLFSANFVENRRCCHNTAVAVRQTIKYCLANDIMKDYLQSRQREVEQIMLWYLEKDEFGQIKYEDGLTKGREEGKIYGIVSGIKGIMETMHITAKEALDAMKIPVDQQEQYLKLLAANP